MGYRTHCIQEREGATVVADEASARRRLSSTVTAAAAERESIESVCERFRPLIYAVTRRYRSLPAGVDRSDLEQEAVKALCELARDYEPDRGIPLAAYLKAKLGWRVAHYLRQEKRRAGHLPLDSLDLDSIPQAVVEAPSPGIASPRISRAIRRLSPRQRAVIAGIFWRERSERELARELGVSHQAVAALLRRAEASLRKDLRPDDA